MTKALIVLAECVDVRSGKRFQVGDQFLPIPALDQANRLISAGCLPQGARDLAEKTAAEDEKAAEIAATRRKKEDTAAAALVNASSAKASADLALEDARTKLAQAVRQDEKTSAEKALAAAEIAAKKASDDLARLSK